jgi:hypothetical protein
MNRPRSSHCSGRLPSLIKLHAGMGVYLQDEKHIANLTAFQTDLKLFYIVHHLFIINKLNYQVLKFGMRYKIYGNQKKLTKYDH